MNLIPPLPGSSGGTKGLIFVLLPLLIIFDIHRKKKVFDPAVLQSPVAFTLIIQGSALMLASLFEPQAGFTVLGALVIRHLLSQPGQRYANRFQFIA